MRRIHKSVNTKKRKAKRLSTSAQRSKVEEFTKRILEESQKRYNVPYGVEVR